MRQYIIAALAACALCAGAQTFDDLKKDINLLVVNDTGRNGYYKQREIADMLGTAAEAIGPEAVLAVGDVHHFNGIESTADPLWLTNYEFIYSHPELLIPWMPVLGNHEYRGNTDAVIGYSNVSRRWDMPARYYTRVFEHKGTTLRVVMIDTTPLIAKYRNNPTEYPDACKQDTSAQKEWLDSVLTVAKEDYVIVVGHHPIYAETPKDESERTDLQQQIDSIIRAHKVDAYINGHIHNFQHIEKPGTDVKYITNSAGSLARKVKPTDGTRFCSPEEGFSIIAADKKELKIHFIDSNGNIIHTISIKKHAR